MSKNDLSGGKGVIGALGGGKAKPSGMIDIAVMQSLSRHRKVNPVVENYGHVAVDECHHVGAVSFDAILKQVKAKYMLGLTATPIRRDGQQPIIIYAVRTYSPYGGEAQGGTSAVGGHSAPLEYAN